MFQVGENLQIATNRPDEPGTTYYYYGTVVEFVSPLLKVNDGFGNETVYDTSSPEFIRANAYAKPPVIQEEIKRESDDAESTTTYPPNDEPANNASEDSKDFDDEDVLRGSDEVPSNDHKGGNN
jgi:hypothetical protein